jgi:hypothetical protein
MTEAYDLLWKPLLEASAQTIVGAIGGYAFNKVLERLQARNHFAGPMDLWKRGIGNNMVQEGDQVYLDGLISPYAQVFPGNPFENGKRWNALYEFEGRISSEQYQALDFFSGTDAALRIGSTNGETLVGLYARYGYVGEGLIGVAPTAMIRKNLPDFLQPRFFGIRAIIGGRLARCPTQHGLVVKEIIRRTGAPEDRIKLDLSKLYYLQINSIKVATKEGERCCSLIGSPWAVTNNSDEQYLVQYGYFDNSTELEGCIDRIRHSPSWQQAAVFFDSIDCPSEELSFKKAFIL